MNALSAVTKALLKTNNLNEETKIETERLTASVRTLEPAVDVPTVVAQSAGKSESVVHLSPDTFSFIKDDDTDIFKTEVASIACLWLCATLCSPRESLLLLRPSTKSFFSDSDEIWYVGIEVDE